MVGYKFAVVYSYILKTWFYHSIFELTLNEDMATVRKYEATYGGSLSHLVSQPSVSVNRVCRGSYSPFRAQPHLHSMCNLLLSGTSCVDTTVYIQSGIIALQVDDVMVM